MALLARSTAHRAVHLRITPRPANIGESREILRLISQFGEVEYFKNLKYDALSAPDAALVVFTEEGAASDCLQRSPIRFRMGRDPVAEEGNTATARGSAQTQQAPEGPQTSAGLSEDSTSRIRGPAGAPFGLSQTRSLYTSSLPTPPRKPPPMPLIERLYTPPVPQARIFQIQTNSARIHFRDRIDEGHYHGRFVIDGQAFAQEDLSRRVPVVGLSCINWKAATKPWKVMGKEKERERAGPSRRKSLRELYEEGAAEQLSLSNDCTRSV